MSWKKVIEPLLLKKYPNSTPEQLLKAHSFAYGGAIMPDIGYSPFGSMIYTDFVHNVRTGDYVVALLEEAESLDEYAFALGSLAHYTADNFGHLQGTNIAVPLVYPKIKSKFAILLLTQKINFPIREWSSDSTFYKLPAEITLLKLIMILLVLILPNL